MGKSKVIGFDAAKLEKDMMNYCVGQNNARLIAYAKKKIQTLGAMIESYPAGKHMNDKGNLLDSLCWGVCYDSKMIGRGFYREQTASRPTIMHARYGQAGFKVPVLTRRGERRVYSKWTYDEVSKDMYNWEYSDVGEPVNGHQLAEEYLSRAESKCKAGEWKVFFAICAPYWGYWEQGFTMRGRHSSKIVQFSVMTQFYDQLNADLKPMKIGKPKIHVEKYRSKSLLASAKKNYRKPERLEEF